MSITKKVTYTTTNDHVEFIDYFEIKTNRIGKGKLILDYLMERNLDEIISIETITTKKVIKFVDKKLGELEIEIDGNVYYNGRLIVEYLDTNYNIECIISIETKMAVV